MHHLHQLWLDPGFPANSLCPPQLHFRLLALHLGQCNICTKTPVGCIALQKLGVTQKSGQLATLCPQVECGCYSGGSGHRQDATQPHNTRTPHTEQRIMANPPPPTKSTCISSYRATTPIFNFNMRHCRLWRWDLVGLVAIIFIRLKIPFQGSQISLTRFSFVKDAASLNLITIE